MPRVTQPGGNTLILIPHIHSIALYKTNSLNPYGRPLRWVLLSPQLLDGETEAQVTPAQGPMASTVPRAVAAIIKSRLIL